MNRQHQKIKIAFIDPVSMCAKYPLPAVNPLGLCYIAAISEQQGHVVKIFQKLDKSKNQFLKEILKFEPDICAFSVFTNNYNYSLALSNILKKKLKCIIIFGGPHPSGDPNIVINKSIDFVVVGEAENTFSELLKSIINKNNNFDKINGIAFLKNKKIIITPPRERIKNLDNLPLPYYRGLPIYKYKRYLSVIPIKKQKFAGMLASRGCPFACHFCVSPILWKQQLYFRNPKKVADEIEFLIRQYRINTIRFLDNDFMVNEKHALAVCNEIIKRKLKISWGCFGSLRKVSLPLLKKMKQAGCADIFYGIESVSQKQLDNANKQLLIKNIKRGLEKTEKVGIIILGGVILGHPKETEQDLIFLNKTLKTLPIDRLELNILTPYPGTMLARQLKPNQYITKNWDCFDNQTPIIKIGISSKKLSMWQKKIYHDYYCSKEYKKRIQNKIKEHPILINFYKNYFYWLKQSLNINISIY